MVKLEFVLNNGTKLNASSETFEIASYQETLNNRQTLLVALGDNGISKGLIQHIVMVDEENPSNVKVDFHNGTSAHLVFPDYDAQATVSNVNNSQENFVILGNAIINRNAIMMTSSIQSN